METLIPEANPEQEVEAPADTTPAEEAEVDETADAETAEESDDQEAETEEAPEQPKYTVKVDGKELEVTLEELQKGYQLERDYRNKTQALAKMREEVTQRTARLDQTLQQGETFIRAMHQELVGDFQNVNWQELARTDPAEYVAKQAEFQARQGKIQQALAAHQQLSQTKQAEVEAITRTQLESERSALLEAVPEWKDEAKMQAGVAEIRGYLKSAGYNDEQIGAITDHRDVVTARKAMLYDRLMQRVPKAKPAPAAPPPPPPAPTKAKSAPNPEKMPMDEWVKRRNKEVAARR